MWMLIFAASAVLVFSALMVAAAQHSALVSRQARNSSQAKIAASQLQQLDQAAGAYLAQHPGFLAQHSGFTGRTLSVSTLTGAKLLPASWKGTNYWGQTASVIVFKNINDESLAWIAYFSGSPTAVALRSTGLWSSGLVTSGPARNIAYQSLAGAIASAGGGYDSVQLTPVILNNHKINGLYGAFQSPPNTAITLGQNAWAGALADNYHLSLAVGPEGPSPGGGTGGPHGPGNICGSIGTYVPGKGCCRTNRRGITTCYPIP
mgnify:CR=1 FL=1